MKKLLYPTVILVMISISAFHLGNAPIFWKIKEDQYTVKIVCDKFSGEFKGLKSEIHFDENNLSASKISASIDANSINTGNGMRNKHAKQGLSADQFPTISFTSTSVTKTASGFEANGKLTIKDVTKDIKLPFRFKSTQDGGIFEGEFSVKPADYHVEKSGTPESFQVQLYVPVNK